MPSVNYQISNILHKSYIIVYTQSREFLIDRAIKIIFIVNRFQDVISTYICALVQFSHSVKALSNPMEGSTPGLPIHHQLPKLSQTHVHWVSDAIQPFHLLSSPSTPALNLSQHQGLLKWVSSSHQVAKVLEFQLQHQSFQWIFRTNFL